MDEVSAKMAMTLAEVVARNTISNVSTRIGMVKEKKKIEEQQAAYEEIINSLLQDKMDLERIAGQYKDLYEKVTISDEDIEHLQNTIEKMLDLLTDTINMEDQREKMELVIKLINNDTLKTMQLLGFNYKDAIGKPLTDACANAIKRGLAVDNKSRPKKSK